MYRTIQLSRVIFWSVVVYCVISLCPVRFYCVFCTAVPSGEMAVYTCSEYVFIGYFSLFVSNYFSKNFHSKTPYSIYASPAMLPTIGDMIMIRSGWPQNDLGSWFSSEQLLEDDKCSVCSARKIQVLKY